MTESPKNGLDFATVLASSVHDMKNSVGMLMASIDQLTTSMPPQHEHEERQYSTLQYEASRINSELVQLLTIYRMQNEFLPVRVDEHYVIDIFDEQVARNKMLIDMRGIQLDIRCDENLFGYFDSDLISSVIHNILVNAIRYTSNKVILAARKENDMLVISVADNGSGYPANMIEQPTTCIQDARVSKDGTHLGLYFAQRIAYLHTDKNRHGYIKLSNGSEIDGGLFEIFIP